MWEGVYSCMKCKYQMGPFCSQTDQNFAEGQRCSTRMRPQQKNSCSVQSCGFPWKQKLLLSQQKPPLPRTETQIMQPVILSGVIELPPLRQNLYWAPGQGGRVGRMDLLLVLRRCSRQSPVFFNRAETGTVSFLSKSPSNIP